MTPAETLITQTTPWRRLILFTLVSCAGGWWSIYLAAGPSGFSMLWIPSGLLFGILLTTPRAHWPWYLLSALFALVLVNVQRSGVGLLPLLLGLCNVFDAWLAAFILTSRGVEIAKLDQINRTMRIAGATIVFACTLSAVLAASFRELLALNITARFDVLFSTWLASHVLGMAIFGTLMAIIQIGARQIMGPAHLRFELVITLLLIALAAWFVFYQKGLPAAFMLLIPLMICVLRHQFRGFVPAIALIAMIASMGTATGHGPFTEGIGAVDEVARVRLLQLFLVCCCGVAFPAASVLVAHRALSERLSLSEQQYRTLADYSRDLIIRVGSQKEIEYISPSVTEVLGWNPAQFRSARNDLIHQDDIALVEDAMAPLYTHGGVASFVYRCRHKAGHYIWLAANVRSVSEKGQRTLVFSARDVTSRVEAEQALVQQARRDPLTGLANRLSFDERLALSLGRSRRNGSCVGLIYIDVDHFKSINDTFGHAAGDHALCEFSRRLGESIRSVDLAVRLGGDEFAVLVEDITNPRSLKFIAEKLLTKMAAPVMFNDIPLQVSISIGIGLSDPAQGNAADLMALADGALYEAKAAGRGTWRLALPPGMSVDTPGNSMLIG